MDECKPLCDGCNAVFHPTCVGLVDVLEDDWFCPLCTDAGVTRANAKKQKAAPVDADDTPIFMLLPPSPAPAAAAAGAEVVEATTQAEVAGVAGAGAGTLPTEFNVSENPLFTPAAAGAAAAGAAAAAAVDAGNFTVSAAEALAAEKPKEASSLALGTTATTPTTTAPSSYRWIPNEPQLTRLDDIFASGISFSRGVEVRRCSLTVSKPVLKAPMVFGFAFKPCF